MRTFDAGIPVSSWTRLRTLATSVSPTTSRSQAIDGDRFGVGRQDERLHEHGS